jgi:hypothetical protein
MFFDWSEAALRMLVVRSVFVEGANLDVSRDKPEGLPSLSGL